MDHPGKAFARRVRELRTEVVSALVALTIGFGVNFTAFALVHAALFRPSPYVSPDRLVFVWQCSQDGKRTPSSLTSFAHWRAQADLLSAVAAVKDSAKDITFTLSGVQAPERVSGVRYLPTLFRLLGISPVVGSLPGDDSASNSVVLTSGAWQRSFGSDPHIVGRTVVLDGVPHTVAAVLPPTFTFPYDRSQWSANQVRYIDFWIPLELPPAGGKWREVSYRIVARLSPSVSLQRAQAILSARWQAEKPLGDWARDARVCLTPIDEDRTRDIAPALWLFLLGSLAVLLAATMNVAAVLVARAVRTDGEAALRLALGATSWDILALHLSNALALCLAAASAALLVTLLSLGALRALMPPLLSGYFEGGWSARSLAIVVVPLALSTIVAGSVAMLAGRSASLSVRLKDVGHLMPSPLTRQIWRALLGVEVAASVVLSVLALQAAASFSALGRVQLGYATVGVSSFRLTTSAFVRAGQDLSTQLDGVRDLLMSLPSVGRVSVSDQTPLRVRTGSRAFSVNGGSATGFASLRLVDEEFLPILGVRLISGRGFVASDRVGSPAVAVVNSQFARRYLHGSAVKERIVLGETSLEVVGVIDDLRDVRPQDPPEALIYLPIRQCGSGGVCGLPNRLHVLTQMVKPGGWAEIRSRMARTYPDVALEEPASVDGDFRSATADQRWILAALTLVAVAALALAATGVYGVVFHSIAARRREFAVRQALGATLLVVQGMVLRETLSSVAGASLAALPVGAFLASVLRTQLFELTEPGIGTYVCSFGLALLAGLAASLTAVRSIDLVESGGVLRADG